HHGGRQLPVAGRRFDPIGPDELDLLSGRRPFGTAGVVRVRDRTGAAGPTAGPRPATGAEPALRRTCPLTSPLAVTRNGRVHQSYWSGLLGEDRVISAEAGIQATRRWMRRMKPHQQSPG